MRQQDVERLIAKYLDGQTSPEEEKRLALALDSAIGRGDAPQTWRVVAQMLGGLTLGEALYDKMLAERLRRTVGRWASGVAAASVALLLGLWLVPQEDVKVDSPPSVAKTEVHVQQMDTRQEEKMPVEETPCTPTASGLPMIAEAKSARKSPSIRIVPTIAEEVTTSEEAESVAEETIAEEDVPVVQEVAEETSTAEEIDIEELRRTYSEEIAQVGRNYYEWEKKQSISLYKMMMNATNGDIERQYVKYSKKDHIINYKQLPI